MLIAFDTSGPHCTVLLSKPDGALIAQSCEELGRGHAERLMPVVETMMEEAGVSWSSITRVGCTTGPGSFTGLRVGLAAARGLVLALKCEGVGVSVFDAMALQAKPQAPFVLAQDARRDQLYIQCFSASSQALGKPEAVDLTNLPAAISPEVEFVAGTGTLLALEVLPRLKAVDTASHVTPQALATACSVVDPAQNPLTPFYLRSADAKPQKALEALRQEAKRAS